MSKPKAQDRFILAIIGALPDALSAALGWPNTLRHQRMAEILMDRFLAHQLRNAPKTLRGLWHRIALSPALPEWCAAFFCEAEGIHAGLAGFVVYESNAGRGPDEAWGGHGWGRILARARTQARAQELADQLQKTTENAVRWSHAAKALYCEPWSHHWWREDFLNIHVRVAVCALDVEGDEEAMPAMRAA